jgi:hypothetical protein
VKFLVVEIQVQLKASLRTDFVLLLLQDPCNFFMFLVQMLYDSVAKAKGVNLHSNYIKGRNLKSQ